MCCTQLLPVLSYYYFLFIPFRVWKTHREPKTAIFLFLVPFEFLVLGCRPNGQDVCNIDLMSFNHGDVVHTGLVSRPTALWKKTSLVLIIRFHRCSNPIFIVYLPNQIPFYSRYLESSHSRVRWLQLLPTDSFGLHDIPVQVDYGEAIISQCVSKSYTRSSSFSPSTH